jgi:ATP-dependent Lon protease
MNQEKDEAQVKARWQKRFWLFLTAFLLWLILRTTFFYALRFGSFFSSLFALLAAFIIYHWMAEESLYKALVKIGSWIGLIKWRLSQHSSPRYLEITNRQRGDRKTEKLEPEFPDDGLGQEIEEWEKERSEGILESLGQGLFASMRADMMKRVYERRKAYLEARRDYYKTGREYIEARLKAKREELHDLEEELDKAREIRSSIRDARGQYEVDIEIKKKELELAELKRDLANLTQEPRSQAARLQEEWAERVEELITQAKNEWELQERLTKLQAELEQKYPDHAAEIEDFIHQKKAEARLLRFSRQERKEDW